MNAVPVAVHADLLFTGEDRELVDGAVVLRAGEVIDVGRAGEVLPRHAGAEIARVRGVVTPGLVNAHTHLELSWLHAKVAGRGGFVAWVDALVSLRSEAHADDEAAAVERAVADLARSGTVAVGDVTNTLAAVGALARHGIGGSIFHEVFGIARDAVLRRVEGLRAELAERVPEWPTPDLAYAPAPHTLYTTHPDAVRALVDAARRSGKPTTIHLAEHDAEREAIERGEGRVVEWLAARTKQTRTWPKEPLFDVAAGLGVLAPSTVLVHLTCARSDELSRVADAGASVVLCPRSNQHIEGRLPPLSAMRAAGLRPALGTDSLASCASLDVLEDAKVLASAFPEVPTRELVVMATSAGARALGRSDLGCFAKGTRPGVLAFELPIGGAAEVTVADLVSAPRRFVVPRPSTVLESVSS